MMPLWLYIVIACIIIAAVVAVIIWKTTSSKKVKVFYPDSKIVRRVVPYRKKKKNGIEKIYYRSGELNKEKMWVEDVLNGPCTTYYKTGAIYIVCNYTDGALDGDWKAFDFKGNILESHQYEKGEALN